MKRTGRHLRVLATAAATLAASTGALLASSAAGHAATAAPAASTGTPIPAHVFAPYFEAYNGDDPAALSQASGAKYLTMAFIQTASKGSCTVDWDGDTSTPISSSTYGSAISTIRAGGGDVIPSFGGYAADNGGTEIADSCTNVSSIAAAYENVITTYNVTRLDLDTEDNSLTNTAGIDRRNKAIKMVEDWAAANGRTVQFTYTLPTTTSGLAGSGLKVLQNAVTNNARVDVVNIMTFDYYDGATHQMANDTKTAATGLEKQLATLYPTKTAAQLWGMVGVTEMPGIDDYGAAETFQTADAAPVLSWANAQGIAEISFWALQRDNGGCVGTGGSDSCSGIAQGMWYFSNTFEPFTSGGTTPPPPTNDFSVGVSPTSASLAQGGTAKATVSTAVTNGSAQSISLTASGAPSGATASLSPTSVTAGGTSTLTVATAATTPPGTYQITVNGSAASGSHSATFTLTVTGQGGGGGGAVVNGGFETGSLSPWTCQSTDSVVASPVHAGSHAAKISPTAGATGECDQAVTGLTPNHAYTLTAYVQGNYAFVGVSGGASASAWTSAAGYTKLSVPFTTDATGNVTVFVHGWYSQGDVYADDFAIS
ncbi:Chitinase [Catenulispora acidiphila DSM 44928]|uniref:chitinase n=1 Tax=Catenulispora acidiphila (strain DSM 44928 / JCM 14897 / NBRC 102108 / NRRL B-24433 / ID139908) TaxID=479433 RepID=C7Q8V3_CATAD|nr:glycosyl hydrolase family 18 protein [Catenulispora acidiphila]ACU70368.1 Chitinase [Catenulispora acidiphila DSM 44928]